MTIIHPMTSTRIALFLLLLATPLLAQRRPAKPLQAYQTPYYIIHTDLTGDQLREAVLRMTKMAEEYHARTRQFAGAINQKLPFHLFTREQDYLDAGGQPGSAGQFSAADSRLMAVAGPRTDARTWDVIQHEGFHQFARAVIGGELPIWVNEGLAEYFGEGIFTGDGFLTGVIPPRRLERIKQQMLDKQFRPIREMMLLAHADWNEELSIVNYDQAWSMVQFLAHGDNGKYAGAFVAFMRAIGRGQPWEQAWLASFGSAEGFEQKWQQYWLSLAEEPTLDLYAKAVTQTITSALARATAQKQRFPNFEEFAAASKAGQLKVDARDWLPPTLVNDAFAISDQLRKREMQFALLAATGGSTPRVLCTMKGGKKLVGRFRLSNGRVAEVVVDSPAR
jgi:hypothetical protein